MTKGSKGLGQSAYSKPAAMIGYASSVPVKTTVSFKGSGRNGGEGSYQTKSRISYHDKQSGCYGRETTTEKALAGEFHWKNGTTGTKSEYTQSSTLRAGHKNGYTEVYNEKTIRDVTYDRSNSGKNSITYHNGDGGSYGRYDNDSDDEGESYGSESDEGDLYGGHGYDSDDDGGSDGGYSYESSEGGSYRDDGYDSDY